MANTKIAALSRALSRCFSALQGMWSDPHSVGKLDAQRSYHLPGASRLPNQTDGIKSYWPRGGRAGGGCEPLRPSQALRDQLREPGNTCLDVQGRFGQGCLKFELILMPP